MKSIHQKTVYELNKLGRELGFKTEKKKLFFSIPDVVWSLNLKELYHRNSDKNIFGLNKDFTIPIAIFEVIHNESEKKMYGSFTKLRLNRALFKAAVLLPKKYQKNDNWKWERYMKGVIDKLSPEFQEINVISDTHIGINRISYKDFLENKSYFKEWLKYFIG